MSVWNSLAQPIYIVAIGLIVVIILLVALLVVSIKLSRLRAVYIKMLSELDAAHLEQALTSYREKAELTAQSLQVQETRLQAIESKLAHMVSRIAVKRFNAFGERGMDLSFSVALLSERQNGVVLTGIHNRDETYVYAKPIANGQSSYKLTPEEWEAINQCLEPAESK